MNDEISLSRSFKELEKNYRILSLITTNEITNGLNPTKSSREFEKNYRTCHY
jgi:hypothetical protein